MLRGVTEGGSQAGQSGRFLPLTQAVSNFMTEKSRFIRQSWTYTHEQVKISYAVQAWSRTAVFT